MGPKPAISHIFLNWESTSGSITETHSSDRVCLEWIWDHCVRSPLHYGRHHISDYHWIGASAISLWLDNQIVKGRGYGALHSSIYSASAR